MSWKKSVSQYVQEIAKNRGQYKALVLLLLGIVTVALGYVGFSRQPTTGYESTTFLDALYRACELFAFKAAEEVAPGNWALEVARWLAPGITLFTLYEFIKALMAEEIRLFRLQFVRWHVIVCGLGYIGPEIVARFRERGTSVVVIEKDPENTNIAACRELGAIVLIGDAADPALLKKARVTRAWYLFAVTGDDGLNSGIAVAAHGIVDRGGEGGLTCFVHVVDSSLCTLLREHQIALDSDRFTLELFNIYQMAGLSVLKDRPPFPALPTPPDTHLLIVGAGRMGRSLIVHAVRQWRETYGHTKKIRITVADREAVGRVESLKLRYPSIGNYCDLRPIQADFRDVAFLQGRFLFEDGRVSVTAVYVCLDDHSLGLAAALEMNQRLRDYAIGHRVGKPDVPITVRTGKEGLVALFNDIRGRSGSFDNLGSFPLIDRACSIDNITGGLNETIARAIHDDYVRKQLQAGKTPETNPSIKPWEKLDETLKESNRNQAVHIREKLQSIGCDIVGLTDWEEELFGFAAPEIEMLAEAEHRRFVEERIRQGWTFAAVKDIVKKQTPYLVPYDQLTEDVKELDRNAIRALPSALARADLKIVRLPGAAGQKSPRVEREIPCGIKS